MLSEPSPTLQSAALTRLLAIVDTSWHMVAPHLPELEELAENGSSKNKDVAAAVASRVFFHLEEPTQALRLALESGKYFDVLAEERSLYVETLVSEAIARYIQLRRAAYEQANSSTTSTVPTPTSTEETMDPEKLSRVVHEMFERCYRDGEYNHALGVALESYETPKVSEILQRCAADQSPADLEVTLQHALEACVNLVSKKSVRNKALGIIAVEYTKLSRKGGKYNVTSLVKCQQLLGNVADVAEVILGLLDGGEELMAFQLCFDLVDNGDLNFVQKVSALLPSKPAQSEGTDVDETVSTDDAVEVTPAPTRSPESYTLLKQAQSILIGGFPGELSLSFLHRNSNSDKLIMESLKKNLDEKGGRNSVLHNCAVVSHAYLNAGTTNDTFLRDHLDWMRKASNWAKFSATTSLGVLHAGHTTEAMTLLEPYLPQAPSTSAAGGYAEGGSLYALGLIHGQNSAISSSKQVEVSSFLREHLRTNHANEVISHGAALGVGLVNMGTGSMEVVNELKELLYTDSAVAGEAAGLAIGMVLVGTVGDGTSSDPATAEERKEILGELKNYARETQHEKIIRGVSMGLALMCYGCEENADVLIEEMRSDRDPVLRYGAAYALSLAYCGTGSNKAIRMLLHTAVSDVNDDVRMAAVIGLAFVLFKTPGRVPQLVRLLLESFNPHVRYASCMAVGIAMSGSGDAESIAMLEPMLDDMTDYVRQGALLATSMIYMQQSDASCGKKLKLFRERLVNITGDKHMSTLTKMGAILGTGLMDVGGRNCELNMASRNGFTKMTTVVGLALWLQHWHWYPMMHMLSLALTPTYTIGLNKDFKYPKNFEINCYSKPSVFAYPKHLEAKKVEKKLRVETVALSTTAKTNARAARKKAKEGADGSEAMEVEKEDVKVDEKTEKKDEKTEKKDEDDAMDVDETKTTEEVADDKEIKKKPPRQPEPLSFRISNPSRITRKQLSVCAFDLKQRYKPIRPNGKPRGVIMLSDSTPEELEEDLVVVRTPYLDGEEEAEPPEPFEWAPPGHAEYVAPEVPKESDKTDEDVAKKDDKKDDEEMEDAKPSVE